MPSFVTALLKPPVEGKRDRVNNAFMACVPRHPLVERALDQLRPQEWYGFDKTALPGSLFFNELIREFPDCLVLPAALFYPSSPAEEEAAVAIHHYARSRANEKDFKKAALLAEARLRDARGQLEVERLAHDETKAHVEKLQTAVNDGSVRGG